MLGEQTELVLRKQNLNCRLHINSGLEVIAVRHGSLTVMLGGNESVTLEANQATIIFPYQLHGFETSEDCDAVVYIFSQRILPNSVIMYEKKIACRKIINMDKNFSEYVAMTTTDFENTENSYGVKALLYGFLAAFVKDNFFVEERPADDEVSGIIEYIYLNMEGNITLETVAAAQGMSESEIKKIFNEHIGITFKEFLHNIRIERAMFLLQGRRLNISEIAYECGFESLRTFNRVFLRKVGCSPTEYRRSKFK